jgi:hypothetical protein
MSLSGTRRKSATLARAVMFAAQSSASLSMILSENRFPPRIKSGAGFFGIML